VVNKQEAVQKPDAGIGKENIKGQGGGANVLAKDRKVVRAVNHSGLTWEHTIFDAFIKLKHNKLRAGVQQRGNRNIHTERGQYVFKPLLKQKQKQNKKQKQKQNKPKTKQNKTKNKNKNKTKTKQKEKN
jgi:hypothetical protein